MEADKLAQQVSDAIVTDSRIQYLHVWLAGVLGGRDYSFATASADASFRRYFRIGHNDQTIIAMDAPPPQENCALFVHAAEVFLAAGLNVPKVIAQDLDQGFLLLSDLGNTTYLSALNDESAPELYSDASAALIQLQLASREDAFPDYDEELLSREMQLFPDWYILKYLGLTLNEKQAAVLSNTFALLNKNILSQGQVFVHRDYHARNLMVCEQNPGILDFQDAVYGAITYDLVSLLKDAYIAWEEPQVLDWTIRYWQSAQKAGLPVPNDFGDFYRDFEWMGAQRHIKVLGIFARLYHRDGKDAYLKDMPLVMEYLRRVCARYVELRPMLRLLDELQGQSPQVGYTF
ncbi:aminoglycoside phosphotransferase family protein [Methyloradius palustris]|nr:phosphotransferase [Methyloradius palustris]